MKMIVGDINLLVSGAEPECGWDATICSLVSGTLAVPVTLTHSQETEYSVRNAIVNENQEQGNGQENRVL